MHLVNAKTAGAGAQDGVLRSGYRLWQQQGRVVGERGAHRVGVQGKDEPGPRLRLAKAPGHGAEGRQGQAGKTGAEVAAVQGSRAGLSRAAEATVT